MIGGDCEVVVVVVVLTGNKTVCGTVCGIGSVVGRTVIVAGAGCAMMGGLDAVGAIWKSR